MNTLVDVLFANALKSSILALGISLLALLPRLRNRPSLQHTLWLAVLAAMIAPPIFTLPLVNVTSFDISSINFRWPSTPAISQSQTTHTPSANHQRPQTEQQPATQLIAPPISGATVSSLSNAQHIAPNPWLACVLTILFIGSGLIIARFAMAITRMRRTLRLATPASPRLSQLAIQAAQLMGIRKHIRMVCVTSQTSPFIWVDRDSIYVVLPDLCESATERELRCIILHELAHYARRDHWSNLFALGVLAICWWNPIAWAAAHRIRTLQEYCCDATAIERSQIAPRDYAECLFKMLEYIHSATVPLPSSACAFLGRNNIKDRFKMIANPKLRFASARWNYLTVAATCLLLPCSIAYSQKDLEDELAEERAALSESLDAAQAKLQQEQDAKDRDAKQWRDTIDQFNALVKNADWEKVEQLANETAKRFGPDDFVVQHMLLTSLNGPRIANGQTPILIERFLPDHIQPNLRELRAFPLKGNLPSDPEERDKYITALIECLKTAIDAGVQSKPAVMAYNEDHALIVASADQLRIELLDEILKRLGSYGNGRGSTAYAPKQR